MSILSNAPLLRGAPAADDSDAYQIEKSLRFNDDDSAHLLRTVAGGNVRTFTLSFWIKNCKDGTRFFSTGYNTSVDAQREGYIGFNSAKLTFNQVGGASGTGGTANCDIRTEQVFRDQSAWYHIVIGVDTTQDISSERVKIHVNGKQAGIDSSYNTYPGQNETFSFAKSGKELTLGCWRLNGSLAGYHDGYFADWYYIDGLALSPAAFGSFDSAGNWNPKAFALPTPNTDAESPTWSNSYDSNNNTPANGDHAFDGSFLTYTSANATQNCGWNPPETITAKCQIRILMELAGSGGGTTAKCNNRERWSDWVAALGRNTKGWWTVPERKLIKNVGGGWNDAINFAYNGNDDVRIYAIEVDGVILKDGKTDKTYLTWLSSHNNDGRDWSTGGQNQESSDQTIWCDGDMGQGWLYDSTYRTFSSTDIVVDKQMEIWHNGGGTTTTLQDGDDNVYQLSSGGNKWVTVQNGNSQSGVPFTGTMKGPVKAKQETGSSYLQGVKVDGYLLIRNLDEKSGGNSFHLKLNDVAENKNLGYSQVLNEATGALPMYGPGADDSTKSSLVLALPGYDTNDHSHTIKGSGSAKTIGTTTGTKQSSSTRSKFYGSALRLDGSTVLNCQPGADFQFGTGAWCVEVWVNPDSNNQTDKGVLHLTESSGYPSGDGCLALVQNGTYWQARVSSDGNTNVLRTADNSVVANEWIHLAVSYDGTNALKFFVNGALANHTGSATQAHDMDSNHSGNLLLGTYWAVGHKWTGYTQDLRIYKGAQKYSAAFTPPTRSDFTVSNITHEASGKIYTSGSDWTGAIWDGSTSTQGGVTGQSYEELTSQSITVNTSFELNTNDEAGQINTIKDGNGNEYQCTDDLGGQTWRVLYNANSQSGTNFTGTLAGPIQVKVSYGGSHIYAVKVDGTILTDDPSSNTDTLVDTPTNYGSGSDVGGVLRGNYATLNPIARTFNDTLRDITNGNLEVEGNSSSNSGIAESTWNQLTGKWYMEFTYVKDANDGYAICGLYNSDYKSHSGTGDGSGSSGSACVNISTNTSVFGSVLNAGDIMGMAADLDNGACYFSKNGTWVGTPTSGGSKTGATATWTAGDKSKNIGVIDIYKSGNKVACNWGQLPFKYTPPTGFKSCCTQNLPDLFTEDDEINNPSKFFDIQLYYGTGGTQNIGGFNFSPEMVWIKSRSDGQDHIVVDKARGDNKVWSPDDETIGEYTLANSVSFSTDNQFDLGSDGTKVNGSGKTYVAWCWDASTSTSISAGDSDYGSPDLASTNYTNATAGIDIVKFSIGAAGDKKIAHRLGAIPDFAILKELNDNSNYHYVLQNAKPNSDAQPLINETYLRLESTAANNGGDNVIGTEGGWTNEIFVVGSGSTFNANTEGIAYLFAEIPGYSKFGKYTGNGNADGQFVYTGFQPKYILVKKTSGVAGWPILDRPRLDLNGAETLYAHDDGLAFNNGGGQWVDFLSNGFKSRQDGGDANGTDDVYFYAAFAAHPFKTARAQAN